MNLLDDIEKELGIATCPINWPIGSGKNFKGVYDRNTKKVMTFSDTLKGTKEGEEKEFALDSEELLTEIGEDYKEQLEEEIELLDGASAEFDMDLVSKGELSPVFFGSALTNFGVEIVPAAFPSDDHISASEKSRYGLDRSVHRRISLHLCLKSRRI